MLALLGSLDIDVTPPLGLVYGYVIWFVSRMIKSNFVNLKPFDMQDLYAFVETLII